MSADRSSRPRPGGSSQSGRPGGRSSGTPSGRPGGRSGSGQRGRSGADGRQGSGRDDRGGQRGDRRGSDSRGGDNRGRDSRGRDDRGRNDRRSGSGTGRRTPEQRREEYGGRPEPRTEAERRAEQVRKTRGPRRTERTPEREQEQIESRTTEQWIDEGSVRDAAEQATRRGGRRGADAPGEIDPEVVAEIHGALDPQRAARLSDRLASASAALDRERYDDAKRLITPLVRELPNVAAVHEVAGLVAYRTGRWRQAAQSLEMARQLKPDPSLLPVLADSYRGLKRWNDVDAVWQEVRSASPSQDIMAEARIVAAGALADQGELSAAIKLMEPAQRPPKRVRDHHLRQWYVLADLYDRAGDTMSASRWFREIAARDAHYGDVRERLRALGR